MPLMLIETASGRDYNRFGLSLSSGTMAAGLAAGSEILQFRWTDATKKALINSVKIFAANAGTGFTAGSAVFDLIRSNAWTVDGTGGTAATLSTGNANITESDADTALTSLRVASTAALTAGTKTLLAHPVAALTAGVVATAGAGIVSDYIFNEDVDERNPIILSTNQGFSIRATVPATGTWNFVLALKWMETK